jgi:hypothetical protein
MHLNVGVTKSISRAATFATCIFCTPGRKYLKQNYESFEAVKSVVLKAFLINYLVETMVNKTRIHSLFHVGGEEWSIV